jgi:hypothetical protein
MKVIIIVIIALFVILFMRPVKNVYTIAYKLGMNYLDNLILDPSYAVMFDIDDTIIFTDNYKPIKPIIKLIKECNKRNILVLIITARDSIYTKETIIELEKNGIYSKYDNFTGSPRNAIFYDFLYLRKNPEDNDILFKSRVKERLARKNGVITVLSIGDNEVDVNGKYSGYAIKLPNVNDNRLFHKDTHGNFVEVK